MSRRSNLLSTIIRAKRELLQNTHQGIAVFNTLRNHEASLTLEEFTNLDFQNDDGLKLYASCILLDCYWSDPMKLDHWKKFAPFFLYVSQNIGDYSGSLGALMKTTIDNCIIISESTLEIVGWLELGTKMQLNYKNDQSALYQINKTLKLAFKKEFIQIKSSSSLEQVKSLIDAFKISTLYKLELTSEINIICITVRNRIGFSLLSNNNEGVLKDYLIIIQDLLNFRLSPSTRRSLEFLSKQINKQLQKGQSNVIDIMRSCLPNIQSHNLYSPTPYPISDSMVMGYDDSYQSSGLHDSKISDNSGSYPVEPSNGDTSEPTRDNTEDVALPDYEFNDPSPMILIDQPQSRACIPHTHCSNRLDFTADPLRSVLQKYYLDISTMKYEKKEQLISSQRNGYTVTKFNAVIEMQNVVILEFAIEDSDINAPASDVYSYIVASEQADYNNYFMRIRGYFTEGNKIVIIASQLGPTLSETLIYHQQLGYYFEEQFFTEAVKSLATTFSLLERSFIVYPRISSSSFMLNESSEFKLAEFQGIIVFLNPMGEENKTFVRMVQKSIKSLGILIYEMATHVKLDYRNIRNGQILTDALSKVNYKWLRDILLRMMTSDKKFRFQSFIEFQEII